MAVHPVTLDLLSTLYSCVKQRAEQARRSVEDELLDLLARAIPTGGELPVDLPEALAPLAMLDDAALWRAARSHLSAAAAARIEALHRKRQGEGLSDAEFATLAGQVRSRRKVGVKGKGVLAPAARRRVNAGEPMAGRTYYLRRAVDADGMVRDILVQERRNREVAKPFMRRHRLARPGGWFWSLPPNHCAVTKREHRPPRSRSMRT